MQGYAALTHGPKAITQLKTS